MFQWIANVWTAVSMFLVGIGPLVWLFAVVAIAIAVVVSLMVGKER